MVKLTLAISSHNHSKFLGQLFDSLLHQPYDDMELLISDDASTDNSPSIIWASVQALKKKFPRVRTHCHPTNQGLNGRNNIKYLVRQEINTPYFGLMDGDDFVHPRRFFKQIQYLEETGMDGVHSDVDMIFEDGSMKLPNFWSSNGCYIENPMTLESQCQNNRIFISTLIAKTDLYKQAFNFELFEEKKIFLGDYAFSNRLVALAPNGIGFIDEALVSYRWREHSESHRDPNLTIADTGYIQALTRSGELLQN